MTSKKIRSKIKELEKEIKLTDKLCVKQDKQSERICRDLYRDRQKIWTRLNSLECGVDVDFEELFDLINRMGYLGKQAALADKASNKIYNVRYKIERKLFKLAEQLKTQHD